MAALYCCACASVVQAAELIRIDDAQRIDPAGLAEALTRGTVIVRLASGESLETAAGTLTAPEDVSLYLGASSEFLSTAVLRGTASLNGDTAGIGDIFVRSIAGSRMERFSFDAEAFLAAVPLSNFNDAERQSLEALRVDQRERIFWGGLQRTGFDAQAPSGDPMMEAVRRDYLLRPAVMQARAAAQGDAEMLGRETAERFVAGLVARDKAVVEALLSPRLFTDGDRDQVEWLTARESFARDLVAGTMPATLSGAAFVAGNLADGYTLDVGGMPWHVAVQPLDTMVFVTAVEPAATEKKL